MSGVFLGTGSLRRVSAEMNDDRNAKKRQTSYLIHCYSRAEQAKDQYVKENGMEHYSQSLVTFTSSLIFRATSSNANSDLMYEDLGLICSAVDITDDFLDHRYIALDVIDDLLDYGHVIIDMMGHP